MSVKADVEVRREGYTLYVVELVSKRAREWGQEHIPEDAAWLGERSFACEHRFIDDIVTGMRADGLEVS